MTSTRLMNLSAATLGIGLTLMTLGNIPPYVFLMAALIMGLVASVEQKAVPATLPVLVRSPFALGLVAFVGWMTLASYTGINPEYSSPRVWILALVVLCGFGYFHVFKAMDVSQHKRVVEWMVNGVIAGFILVVLLFIFEPWFLKIGFYEPNDAWTIMRLRFFSSVLAVLLPFCWLWWLQDGKGGFALTKKAMVLIAISMLVTLICAGRAGWMGLAVGGSLFAVLLARYHGLRFNWKLLAGGLSAFAVIGLGVFIALFGFASLGERIGLIIPERGLGGGRLDIWAMAWQGMQDHPLTGIGMNAFRFIPGADYHPHNFILQLGLEGGYPALALALALFGGALYVWWKAVKVSPMMAAVFCSLIAYLVCALTNRSVFNPEWMIYLMFIASFGAGMYGREMAVKPVKAAAKAKSKAKK